MSTSIPSSDCSLQTCDLSRSHFAYSPAHPAAEAYITYFALFLVLQAGLGVWYRTWHLLAGAFSCFLLYMLGFIAAAKLSADPFSDGWFSLYLFGLTVAPSLLTLSLVICVKQILAMSLSRAYLLTEGKYRHAALSLQCISVFFQIVGMAVMAGNTALSPSQSGADVAVFGLAIQVLTLGLVCGACAFAACSVFGRPGLRLQRGKGGSDLGENNVPKTPAHSKMFKVYVVAMAIVLLSTWIATILQAVIIAGGREGQHLRVQDLYYWQGICMAIAVFALAACHPGLGLNHFRKGVVNGAATDTA